MHESSGYQLILDEGRADGIQKTLLRLGRKHLGDPTPQVEAAVKSNTDFDKLQRWMDRLMEGVKTWQELLDTP